MSRRDTPFFIGFLPVPKALRGTLIASAAILVIGFGALAIAVGGTQGDPGPGAFRFDLGRQNVKGVLEMKPYPLLRVTEGSEAIPAGTTLMMSGGGKNGLMQRAMLVRAPLAEASGVLLTRGDLLMMQVRGGRDGLGEATGPAPEVAPPEDLGRWRLAGEICDGKCLAGAMRPGTGIAHKACANLCIVGGVPPVFVSTQPVEGEEFLLVAGPDGNAMPPEMLDHVGAFVSVEGEIERRGDLLIFKADPATVRPATAATAAAEDGEDAG